MPKRPRSATTSVGNAAPDADLKAAARAADAFACLNLRLRARMLGRLLASVGSLALAVVGGGAFAKYLTATTRGVGVSLEDAARATWSQVFELLRYVQQSNPPLFERMRAEIAGLGALQMA